MPSLVTCRNCNVQYAPSAGQCPACGSAYAPTREERIRVAYDDAERWIKEGNSIRRVRHLVTTTHGLNEETVDAVMKAAALRERELLKQHGQYVATSGCLLTVGAMGALFITGNFLLALGGVVLGVAVFGVGVLQFWTGWKLVSDQTVQSSPEARSARYE